MVSKSSTGTSLNIFGTWEDSVFEFTCLGRFQIVEKLLTRPGPPAKQPQRLHARVCHQADHAIVAYPRPNAAAHHSYRVTVFRPRVPPRRPLPLPVALVEANIPFSSSSSQDRVPSL
jgi:hypothetical protein